MIIYTYIILGFLFISVGVASQRKGPEMLHNLLSLLILFPIIGRVLGWW